MIPLKAIVTLNHCHNHLLEPVLYANKKEKKIEKQCEDIFNSSKIHHKIDSNSSSKTNSNEFCYSDTMSSSTQVLSKNKHNESTAKITEDNVILNEPEENTLTINDGIQNVPIENDNFELSEEFDSFILVENGDTVNSLHDDDNVNELFQLLSDFDSVNERMLLRFESNPDYFLSAINSYITAMKNNLTSKESLLTALHSFGKDLQKKN